LTDQERSLLEFTKIPFFPLIFFAAYVFLLFRAIRDTTKQQWPIRSLALSLGVVIWILSPMRTGQVVLFDVGGSFYWLSVLVAGLVIGGIDPDDAGITPIWVAAGQLGAWLVLEIFGFSNIYVRQAEFVIALSLMPCYVGAFSAAIFINLRKRT
jgi:hypothetical protein